MLQEEAGSYYMWQSFASMARRRAESLLLSEAAAIKTNIHLSVSLVHRVSSHWAQTELRAAYEAQIRNNLYGLLYNVRTPPRGFRV